MSKMSTLSAVAMIAMVTLSFTNLFGAKIAGASVFVGVIAFFVNKAREKRQFEGSGLDFKAIPSNLRQSSIWFWIAMPIIMDGVSITLAKLFLPEYIPHVLSRAEPFITLTNPALLLVQLIVLALGEEIAWRAFFQQQLNKMLSIAPVLLISAVLFGIGHFTPGAKAVIVIFDVFFVAVNGALYGVIFHKTKNAWVSTLSHFAANLFSILVIPRLLG
ncbi:MAG: CPBP family intramembrane glutamic endopeptidase [Bacillota bacterium]